MWGLFVGFAIGVLQIVALKKLGEMMIGGSAAIKLVAGALFAVKIAFIVWILYMLSTLSLGHLIWAAGGILIGLICASVFLLKRSKKSD